MSTEYAIPAEVPRPDRRAPPGGPLGRWLLADRVAPSGPASPESYAKPHAW